MAETTLEPDTREVRGACPLDCPDTCSWIVTVKGGEAVAPARRSGAPVHARIAVQQGRRLPELRARAPTACCIRCAGSGRRATASSSASRGTRRSTRSPRGSATSSPATAREAIWPFIGTGNMGLIHGAYGAGRRLWNALGTSRHVQTICTIAGGFGTGYTLGENRVGMDPETLRFSKLVVLWGANVLSTHPHLWRPILEARKSGAQVVVIDPIRTRTAAASDWHLAPLPGTDAALALGLLHVVVGEGREDREFIAGHTLGWEAFRARILEFPPARVAAITGLPAESIVELGRRLAETRPTGIRIGIGLQRHGGGGMAVRTITLHPRRDRRLALPRRRRPLRHPRLLRRELGGAVARRPAAAADAGPAHDAARRRAARARRPAGQGAVRLRQQSRGQRAASDQGPARPGARRPVHGRRRALPDRHRPLRRHRAAGDDADRAPRSADRLRPPVPGLERAGGAAARRVPADDGDLPAPGAHDGPRRAGALRQRRGRSRGRCSTAGIRRWPASRSRR